MTYVTGIDVGSTYTKAVILRDGKEIVSHAMLSTGFRLEEAAHKAFHNASIWPDFKRPTVPIW